MGKFFDFRNSFMAIVFLNFTIVIPADFKHLKLGINLNELKIFSNLTLVTIKFSQNELINPELSFVFEFD